MQKDNYSLQATYSIPFHTFTDYCSDVFGILTIKINPSPKTFESRKLSKDDQHYYSTGEEKKCRPWRF